MKKMRSATDLPIWIKPNEGLPEVINGKVVYGATPKDFARFVPELVKSGASFVGSYCGTNQDFIEMIKKFSNGKGKTNLLSPLKIK